MSTLIAYRLPNLPTMELVPASSARSWMNETDQRWAYRCLPMVIANEAGWFVLNNETIFVTWSGSKDPSSLQITGAANGSFSPARSLFGYGILTWKVPFLFRTSPGYSLLVRGPSNWPKDSVYALEGIVETDWAVQTFTMNWKITRPNTVVQFLVNEPICMIVPQRCETLEEYRPVIDDLVAHPELARGYELFSQSREAFNANLRKSFSKLVKDYWQGHYFRGLSPDGSHASDHRTKLTLSPFDDVKSRAGDRGD